MADWSEGDVAVNGTNIHYHRTGDGRQPAMLLLHGVTDNGLCWSRVAAHLGDRYDVVMMDARGHGGSDRLGGPFSVPMLAEDAAGVIRGLGLEKPVVFGHSMGAITAIALAADCPELVGAIIVEDPPLRAASMQPPPGFMEARRKEFDAMQRMSFEERCALCATQNPGWHQLEIEPWARSKPEVDPNVLNQFGTFDRFSWREAVARLQCPGLILTGDPDKMAIVTPEIAAETVAVWKNGEVVRFPGAGHCIHRDRWDESMAAVDAFLERR